MANVNDLGSRIDAELSAVAAKVKSSQVEQAEAQKQREKRLEHLGKVFDEMREIWRPRLELLSRKFEGRFQATPRIVPSTREVTFNFQSRLARVNLKLSAFTDKDIEKLILSYDLEIIPILMRFKQHDDVEFPLNNIDKEAVATWLDDRIVDFVKTYFSMGENEIYLKDYMVEDPIAHVSFPKQAAASTLEREGHLFYFITEETRREFEKQPAISSK